MDLVIATNSVPLSGADTAPATGTPQYFTNGNPVSGVPATNIPAYILNDLITEIRTVIIAAGLTPDKTNNTQLNTAIADLIAAAAFPASSVPAAYGANVTPGGIGSYAIGFTQQSSGILFTVGTTYSAASLQSTFGTSQNGMQCFSFSSGTWKCMGFNPGGVGGWGGTDYWINNVFVRVA